MMNANLCKQMVGENFSSALQLNTVLRVAAKVSDHVGRDPEVKCHICLNCTVSHLLMSSLEFDTCLNSRNHHTIVAYNSLYNDIFAAFYISKTIHQTEFKANYSGYPPLLLVTSSR